MWPTFSMLQIVVCLPLLNLETPANVMIVQEEFRKIIYLEVVDKEKVYTWVFGESDESVGTEEQEADVRLLQSSDVLTPELEEHK